MFRTLDETMLVSPQIGPADIAAAADQGVVLIINNRPEGEEPGQPEGAAIEAAARAAGLGYVAIPVDHAGLSLDQVEAMGAALDGVEGRTLAYCRSGTRSTYLWALARARAGDSPDQIRAKAANAGYDLTPLMGLMTQLQG
ncbi:TIGR01244 family sulfur transferase [Sphingomonas morindae]|uniref:TIGR01244 family phosphatase n=1 Tax=Sphingomonas morindae TaxID=1541170 RepID=A0ABY4XB81_9SPHN|nr:TIGR01244 family sulfur transferase [Sphingomonas morindae]USI74230.1 TIGR01244 family phosphatase [Sphingomonas morindae]